MIQIETELKILHQKLQCLRTNYVEKQKFVTGIDVLDQKMGVFSEDKNYLFIASEAKSLQVLKKAIQHNLNIIYQENISKNRLFFRYLPKFSLDDCENIVSNYISNFDFIIGLKLSANSEITCWDSGKFTEANLHFKIFSTHRKPQAGIMRVNPNAYKVKSDFDSKIYFSGKKHNRNSTK